MLVDRISQVLRPLKQPSIAELRNALVKIDASYRELSPFLESTSNKPYYRKLLYQSDEVELLVMNWSNLDCAPHDHGSSYGWIQVIGGACKNTLFQVEGNELPEEIFHKTYQQGSTFFAPQKAVHKMNGENGLVTLHLYAPPITGMKVYDLERCRMCIVADDCGAWWPEEQRQKLQELRLKNKNTSQK
ncbi:cysteine desulfurase [Bacillus sp. JCM 19046]|nr:cysteine desulfurase [Bacillus sp. JCM 19045]GAF16420.1 cysteine desulfurase [Bacillus sp. JCM 19046]